MAVSVTSRESEELRSVSAALRRANTRRNGDIPDLASRQQGLLKLAIEHQLNAGRLRNKEGAERRIPVTGQLPFDPDHWQ